MNFLEDKKSRKELLAKYKEREIIGGVYVIKSIVNNIILLKAVTDLRGSVNLFEFSRETGSCVDMKLQSDWNKQGSDKFIFEVLEELKKGETQTDEEFRADISFLKELWAEKLSDKEFY
jgi:hypothetical protein